MYVNFLLSSFVLVFVKHNMAKDCGKNFFKQNGKVLKGLITPVDAVSSIGAFNEQISSLAIAEVNKPRFAGLKDTFSLTAAKIGSATKSLNSSFSVALGGIAAIVLTVSTSFVFIPPTNTHITSNKYNIFASKPLDMEKSTYTINLKDSRAQKINEILKAYNCPLEGMGETIVDAADANGIPWWLVASISFQESSCGKKTPKVDGQESYNAWGWAIYGDNVHTFDNWARGIEVVSKYLGDNFYKKGTTNVCDIMKIYTPPSNGSWCQGVTYYGDEIQNYKTPHQL